MERKTPYSQRASVMFYVIEIRSKKNVMHKDIAAMITTKIVKTALRDL